MNKVCISGRLVKDPEIRYSQSGSSILSFTLAVSRNQKDANGNYISDFIPCKAFGGSADYIGKYCHKGNMLGITGRIITGSYKGQDGQMHYTEDVVVEGVENFSPRESNQNPTHNPQASAPNPNQYRNPSYGQPMQNPGSGIPEDDVPF